LIVNELLGINESYKAPDRLMQILFDRERRESLFQEFLTAFNYDVSYDWFHEYFMDEHADRRNKKQDFTPQSIAKLVTSLVGDNYDGLHYEPCAGTGGMTIAAWNRDRMQHSPFDYRPSWYVYHCEELSDRALPFLLFNLAIRGMNAVVVHCDVLSRKAYGAFFIQNENDDHLQFSTINVLPYTDSMAKYLAVTWAEQRYKSHVESPGIPRHIFEPVPRGQVSDFTRLVYAMAGVEVSE
jgi:type I restriction-modification system DNA methylase subunit